MGDWMSPPEASNESRLVTRMCLQFGGSFVDRILSATTVCSLFSCSRPWTKTVQVDLARSVLSAKQPGRCGEHSSHSNCQRRPIDNTSKSNALTPCCIFV